jgi:CubicO group peptidase (beta-lactamase class C family)
MSSLEILVEPASMGFDPLRLERIKAHFDQYVADHRLAGWLATVSRGGELVWTGQGGHRDREKGLEVTDDTIWRIYSMTKPLTSIGAMMLYEEGLFDLNDEAGKWIESLRESRVYVSGTAENPQTAAATTPVTIAHLMTHTSGLTYDFQRMHVADEIYRAKGYDFATRKEIDLAGAVDDWCTSPLVFEPGSHFNYSVATDVLGRLIEIWSGQPLDEFFTERILEPLGMSDTQWWCAEDQRDRLAQLYVPFEGDSFAYDDVAKFAMQRPHYISGGGGLLSTARDYERFMQMLLGGGELDGVRLVSGRTLGLMTQNHLRGGADLDSFAVDSYAETSLAGIGFGLGFAVVVDQVKNRSLISNGSFYWGGAASTAFWVDPVEDMTVGFYTQLLPSGTYPIRRELQQLVYQSLVD